MTLTRNASNTNWLDIAASMTGDNIGGSGNVSVNYAETSSNSFTYNTFGVCCTDAGTSAGSFDATLFKVETLTIPELSTFALVGIALPGLVVGRRRLRR
jgi:hypothetical protein